ncbi:superoxide dismutase family protein [Aestuariibius sp. 2305UL40-4]
MTADGTAIVIHANEDDQLTQPIGGSGPRIVCGLVERS